MAARIVLNGQLAWGTLGLGTARAAPRTVLLDRDPESGALLEAPSYRREGPVVGVPWQDPDSGLRYRVVQRLSTSEGWVGAPTIMRWYSITHRQVLDLLERGLLDGALEVCSPTKKYRVLDPAKVIAHLASTPDRKPARRGRRVAR